MKIREIFEHTEDRNETDEKNVTEGSVKKVSKIFEVMMRKEKDRNRDPVSSKKKKRDVKKVIKKLDDKKTVLDRWIEKKRETEVIGRQYAGETGISGQLVRKDTKQIKDSQKCSVGDLNPKVRRHSTPEQKEKDTNLQKQENKSLKLVQKQMILREKVKIWDSFYRSEKKNGVEDEKEKKGGQHLKIGKSSENFKGAKFAKDKKGNVLTTTTTRSEKSMPWTDVSNKS